jgi:hypothetical protein
MVENMKAKAIKTIMVRFAHDNQHELEVDADIFEDPFLEAATRAVEKIGFKKGSMLRAITECWDKNNPKRSALYNTYWVLVNAAHYDEAERLRDKFKAQTDCDLAKEPKCGTKAVKRKS